MHRRTAFLPIVEAGDGARTASKYAGLPWLASGESWPSCPSCHEPLRLFLQLNLSSLPPEADVGPREGLVQLFYCPGSEKVHCEVDHAAWEPFAKTVIARLVMPSGEPAAVAVPTNAFPAQRIVGWTPREDLPNGEEAEELGVDRAALKAFWDGAPETPLAGDKLWGWPYWVQGMEYPNCPRCGERMALLYQLDSEGNIPFMFGDSGCAHLTRCHNHPDVLAFAWACC